MRFMYYKNCESLKFPFFYFWVFFPAYDSGTVIRDVDQTQKHISKHRVRRNTINTLGNTTSQSVGSSFTERSDPD